MGGTGNVQVNILKPVDAVSQNTINQSNMPASKSNCSLSAAGGTSTSSNNVTSSNESGTASNSYDFYRHTTVFFQTEKINLPRGKVVEPDSCHSSPSHGFR